MNLSEVLLLHVVSMVPDRSTRERLGYNYEQCIQLGIPPCRLEMKRDDLELLMECKVLNRWNCTARPRVIYYPETHQYVSIAMHERHFIMYVIYARHGMYKSLNWALGSTIHPYVHSWRPIEGQFYGLGTAIVRQ